MTPNPFVYGPIGPERFLKNWRHLTPPRDVTAAWALNIQSFCLSIFALKLRLLHSNALHHLICVCRQCYIKSARQIKRVYALLYQAGADANFTVQL